MDTQSGKPKRNRDEDPWLAAGRYLGLTTSLPAAIFIGYEIGAWLDSHLSTDFLKIVFVIVGTFAGILPIFRELRRND